MTQAEALGTSQSVFGGQYGSHLEFKEIGDVSSGIWVDNKRPSEGFMQATVAYSKTLLHTTALLALVIVFQSSIA